MRHESLVEATIAAHKLATKTGQTAHILETIGAMCPEDVEPPKDGYKPKAVYIPKLEKEKRVAWLKHNIANLQHCLSQIETTPETQLLTQHNL